MTNSRETYSNFTLDEFFNAIKWPKEYRHERDPFFFWSIVTAILIGVFGTILNVIIFTRPKMGCSPINNLLASLEASNLLLYFFGTPFTLSYYYGNALYYFYSVIALVHLAFTFIFTFAANWFMFVISVWRLIGIRYPFKAEQYCGKTRTKRAILAILTLAVLIMIPEMSQFHVKKQFLYVPELRDKPFFMYTPNTMDHTFLGWLPLTILCNALPSLCLGIVNIILLRQLIIVRRERRNLNSDIHLQSNAELRITFTLLVYNCLYLVCSAVSVLWGIGGMLMIEDKDLLYSIKLWELYGTAYTFSFYNATSILFYCYMSQNFRDTLKSLFRCPMNK